jgi:2-keto-4-pentenoate hydratase/GNAT superfamily N-acetyltransferase
MGPAIAAATATDIPAVLALLEASGLPTAGLADHAATVLVARDGGVIIASAALESYGTVALLRSVAVAPVARGRGLGRRLTLAAVDLARTLGIETLYLLTETAEGFFRALGFYPLPRDEVPDAVRASVEFTSTCPASARAMRSLTTDGRVLRGTRTQLARWRAGLAAGTARVGWKIGLNDPAVQRHLALDGSVVGHLVASGVLASGASHALAGGTRVVVEPEVAIAVGADVPAGASRAVATAAIAGLGAALEIVDLTGPFDDLEQMIAGNLFHRGVVFGPPEPPCRRRTLDGVGARLVRSGRIAERAMAGDVVGDPADVVRLVADTLGAFGEILRAGDRIISGSITRPVAVVPGSVAGVDLGPLGAIEVRFTE